MERSDRALAACARAYERAHVVSRAAGSCSPAAFAVLAIGLHRTTHATWLVVAALAATLAALGWRGGAWRRGALAGMLAGLPVFLAPTIVFAIAHGGHCPDCPLGPTLACLATCFGTSALVGIAIGFAARRDASPRRFGSRALATALLVGLLGCATTGLGGAIGIVARPRRGRRHRLGRRQGAPRTRDIPACDEEVVLSDRLHRPRVAAARSPRRRHDARAPPAAKADDPSCPLLVPGASVAVEDTDQRCARSCSSPPAATLDAAASRAARSRRCTARRTARPTRWA